MKEEKRVKQGEEKGREICIWRDAPQGIPIEELGDPVDELGDPVEELEDPVDELAEPVG
jgi:hypothetical protein